MLATSSHTHTHTHTHKYFSTGRYLSSAAANHLPDYTVSKPQSKQQSKVKLSLHLTENHVMKRRGEVEVQLHAVLTSVLDAVSFTARPLYHREGKGSRYHRSLVRPARDMITKLSYPGYSTMQTEHLYLI
jgi:hypothetical protein